MVVCGLCKGLLSIVLMHEVGVTRNIPLGQGLPRLPQLNQDLESITVINRNTYFARGRGWRDYFFLVPFFAIMKGPQTLQLRGLGHRWALYPFFWLW